MSESNDERSPGFNKSLTSKLIAAGVFVVLGTAGVAYYLNSCRNCEPDSKQVAELDIQEPDNQTKSSSEDGKQEQDKQAGSQTPTLALKPVAKQSADNPAKNTNAIPSSNPSTNNSFSSSFQNNKNVGNSFSSSGQKNTGLPPSKSFAMPKVVKSSNFSDQSNSPNGSNQSTFSPIQEPKKPIKEAANSVANRFNQIKQNTGQLANRAIQNTKQTTNEIVQKTSNSLRSFGNPVQNSPNQSTNRLNQPRSSFSPQTANSPNQQSALPPVSTRNSFDQSKDLKPFAPTNAAKNVPSNGLPVSQRNNGFAGSGSRITSTQQSKTLPVGNIQTKPNSRIQNVSATVGSRSSIPNLSSSSTRNVPGDRKLEGLQAPSVTIEKIAPREIQVNKPADFQLVVKNVGRIPANNVVVFDQIPTGTELIQSVPQPRRGSNSQVSWELDTLNPGQEKRIKLQLRPTTPGEIGSVAQVSFSAMASMRTKVTKPVLSINHSVSPRVLIGDPVVLNIDVTNEGDGPATEVLIQEDLPQGLSFSEGFRELEYAVGTLGPGQSRKIRLELKAANIGKYRNVIIARADGGLQAQHAVDVEVIAPTLQASGEGPTRRFLNREATHRFAVRNSGTAPATNVELICRLPNGLRYVSANNRGKYDENSHSVYWSLAELNAGLVANVELTTMPIKTGNQDLNFEAISDLNQKADTICKLNVEHLVDVFFDIDDLVDPIEIGSDTAYKLRIENQGTKTATNVQLQVDFPQGIQPTAVEGNIDNEIRGQQIAFQPITSLNPGDEVEITIRGKGITAGDHRIAVSLVVDGREVNVSKQESTRVYSDR